jgi:hypothetical protein
LGLAGGELEAEHPVAGGEPLRLKKALLLIPASAVLMVGLNVAIWTALR